MTDIDQTVFIVDDNKGMRDAIRWLLETIGLTCETYDSAEDFLAADAKDRPGCLVLDIRMPGMSGLELQERLAAEGIELPTIIITAHGDVPAAVRALKAGAVDFLEKPFSDQILLERIQHCLRLDAERRLKSGEIGDIEQRLESLTPREREVLEQMVEGKTTKEMAWTLSLSPKTVEIHRGNLMRKMGANSAVDLVNLVHRVELAKRP